MAVLSVAESYDSRSTEIKMFGKLAHTRAFIVQTSKNDASTVAALAAGVPALGDYHTDNQSRVINVQAKPKGSEPGVWIVTVKYSNDLPKKDIEETDPISVDQVESWSTEERTKYVTTDINGKQILNAANDRYDEPIEVTASYPTLTVKRNESFFNTTTAFSYNNALNSDTFRGAEPGTMRVRITAEQAHQDDTDYWKVTYVFSYNPDGWQATILEAGLYQYGYVPAPVNDFIKSPCTEKGDDTRVGTPVRQPVPLYAKNTDADGNIKNDAVDAFFSATTTGVPVGQQIDPSNLPDHAMYTTWKVYRELPFANLLV